MTCKYPPVAPVVPLVVLLNLVLLAAVKFSPAWGAAPRAEPPAATAQTPAPTAATARRDVHSFARPEEVRVEHLDLDVTVDFARRTLRGRASLRLRNLTGATHLHLDTRDLTIQGVSRDGQPTPFALGAEVPFLGRELIVEILPETQVIHLDYETQPQAAALQWLTPSQTAGGQHPFLFTQSQAILARTWVPCQDTPSVRMTYRATVRVPPHLWAVMSAENSTTRTPDGIYRFHMPQPIPSYLLALAVGDLAFRPLGARTGIYAEPSVIDRAAHEFVETEDMLTAVEALYGPYRWGRYDMIVLPPSFPFGGMENPRLTFVTPTLLAGDRSLVSLIAHELAHSWSGNLVTNATWNDFWLNEGFTVYLERRIMEALKGKDYADMLAILGRQDLEAELARQGPHSPDTRLALDLTGRDPDDSGSDIAYEKGYFLLRLLEEKLGRARFDAFLKGYFARNAWNSLTTAEFLAQLEAELGPAITQAGVDVRAWIHQTDLPAELPQVVSRAFAQVEAQIAAWRAGTPATSLAVAGWSTHEWLHFLRKLPDQITSADLEQLDAAFAFTRTGNAEILNEWLLRAIDHRYQPAYPALREFLLRVGRRKFLRVLYQRLVDTEQIQLAREIYAQARPGYHSVAASAVDDILK